MEHLTGRMVQEMVLHPQRAKHDHPLCDVGLIPERKNSWSEKPEHLEQIAELLRLIPWGKLDGPSVVGNFIS